jgi:hypothetical protein
MLLLNAVAVIKLLPSETTVCDKFTVHVLPDPETIKVPFNIPVP